jgi:hypothetical protein
MTTVRTTTVPARLRLRTALGLPEDATADAVAEAVEELAEQPNRIRYAWAQLVRERADALDELAVVRRRVDEASCECECRCRSREAGAGAGDVVHGPACVPCLGCQLVEVLR